MYHFNDDDDDDDEGKIIRDQCSSNASESLRISSLPLIKIIMRMMEMVMMFSIYSRTFRVQA